ncbi:hypothetical protein NA56DRAFT_702266 [Hyaloscypha hepaticicola]|uniref:2EXR domain-containing protein n=1 Tax=Hyaloscypha hepaticicola TaxID=2082293 RepID=A0A2J6Q8A0_9HELO|nr:hypothetical protein NA56DRAFT_702266 [Hyaloscypha hepaticicola]
MSSKYYDRLFLTESPPKPLHKFSYFPKLPSEVQAMIWKVAAADDKSRIVEFFIKKDEAKQEKELSIHHQPPALLHVNQQAWKWTIKYFQAFLGKEDYIVFMEDSIAPKVYTSRVRNEKSKYKPEVVKKVKFLVMGGIDGYSSMRDFEKCGYANLEKIVLEKQEGVLNPEQKAHLSPSWYHYVSLDEERELSCLTEQQMIRKTILQLELETGFTEGLASRSTHREVTPCSSHRFQSRPVALSPLSLRPKVAACINSNLNPIPQNHKCPSCTSCTKISCTTFTSAFSEKTAPPKY